MAKKIDLKNLGSKVTQVVADTGVVVGGTAKKTLEITQNVGQKSVVAVQKGASDISDKMKNVGYQKRLKKFNPLFPNEFFSESFHVPNVISIVDDAVRRGIDVCEGAIGWLGKAEDTEVLYLYDEFMNECGITFVPSPQCDAIYYVDPFDKKRFVKTDDIFAIAHEGQVAELRHIAEKLGAKKCTIEIVEAHKSYLKSDKKVALEEHKELSEKASVSVTEGVELNFENQSYEAQEGRITATFVGSNEPQVPQLKWFKYNDSIKNLIEMRMSGQNNSTIETIEFKGVSTSAISKKAAYAIDTALSGIDVKNSSSLSKKMEQENTKKMFFKVEF